MRRVLVVDDSETVRQTLKEMLQAKYEVLLASTGELGLALAKANRPDVLVTDLNMPMMSGVELLRRLRADPQTKALPVLVVTTVTEVATVNACRALGCAGFVLKPVREEYLLAKIGSLIPK
jgi:CheY-like chemotaxis protein